MAHDRVWTVVVRGHLLHQGDDQVWFAPLTYCALLMAVGLLSAALAHRLGGRAPVAVPLLAAGTVGVWSQTLLHPGLHGIAALLLAAGAASVATRCAIARWGPSTMRWIAVALACGLVLLPLAAVGQRWARRAASAARIEALPPADAGAVNVLLVVLDTVRADHLSVYGYERETTPRLERLAARGVTFERAMSTSPWTLPAHSSLFTGRYVHELSAGYRTALDDTDPTLAEAFAAAGYATAGFVGNVRYAGRGTGLGRGFAEYVDYQTTPALLLMSTAVGRFAAHLRRGPIASQMLRVGADAVCTAFEDWVARRGERPFFAFLNLFDAHTVYLPPADYAARFGPPAANPWNWDRDARHRSAAELQGFRNSYDALLAYIDARLDRTLSQLKQTGVLDRTLVVVTGDHGEHFGEHGLLGHANSLYQPLLHVPWIVAGPTVARGARITTPVSIRDVAATVLDLTDVRPRTPFPGHSLATALRQGTNTLTGLSQSALLASVKRSIRTPPWQPVSRGDMAALIADGLYYIRGSWGAEELFDLHTDPDQHTDLSTHPRYQQHLATLRTRIEAHSLTPR